MQIDSALSSTLPGPDRATTKSPSAADDAVMQTSTVDAPHAGRRRPYLRGRRGDGDAAQDGNTGQDGAASDSASEGTPASGVSAVKSFAYGTLGLERPDQPQEARNAFYTAGKVAGSGHHPRRDHFAACLREERTRLPCEMHDKRDC